MESVPGNVLKLASFGENAHQYGSVAPWLIMYAAIVLVKSGAYRMIE